MPEAEDEDRLEAFDAVRLFVSAARRVEPASSPAPRRRRSSTSAARSRACRWRSSLPHRGRACCPAPRSPPSCARAASCCAPWIRRDRRGTRASRWCSTIPGGCSAPAEREALGAAVRFPRRLLAEAARAVAAPLPVLGALADKSLLRKEEARIFLHPLVQQLAADATRRRRGARPRGARARAVLPSAAGADAAPRSTTAIARRCAALDAEFDNCRAAWQRRDADARRRSTPRRQRPHVMHYCDHRGRFDEGLALMSEALGSPRPRAGPACAPLLQSRAAPAVPAGSLRRGAWRRRRRRSRARDAGRDHDARLQCFKVLGACSLRLGRWPTRVATSARRWRRRRPKAIRTTPRRCSTTWRWSRRRWATTTRRLRMSIESLVQHRRLGDVAGEALCLNNLAALPGVARRLAERARQRLRRPGPVRPPRAGRHARLHPRQPGRGGDRSWASPMTARGHARERARAGGGGGQPGDRGLGPPPAGADRGAQAAISRGARQALRDALELALAVDRPLLAAAGDAVFADLLAAQGERRARGAPARASPIGHPSMTVQGRRRAAAAPRGAADADGETPSRPGRAALDELARRIVVETPAAHAG